jgi:hypothetical protein
MKILTTLFFLISLTASAWAQPVPTSVAPTPIRIRAGSGPEISAGVLGMTLVAGVLYLLKRRNRA